MKKIILLFLFISIQAITGDEIRFPKLPKTNHETLKKIHSTGIPSNDIYELFFKDNLLWVLTSEGLAVTEDWGNNWEEHLLYNEINEVIFSMQYCPANDTYYASSGYMRDYATFDEAVPFGTGVYKKTSSDNNWEFEPIYFKDQFPQKVGYETAILDSTIYIAYVRGNLITKQINDTSWRVIIPDENPDNDTLYTEEYPPSFDYPNDFNNIALSIKIDRDSIIWLGTAGGLKVSKDKGRTFQSYNAQTTENFPGNQIWELTDYYEDDKKYIFLSCTNSGYTGEKNGVAYTLDDGETWITIDAYEHISPLSLKASRGILWAGTDRGLTIWDIANGGDIIWFNKENSDLQDDYIASLAAYDFYMWIGTYNGLAYTVNQGASFSVIQKSFPTAYAGIKETYSFPNPFAPRQGQLAQIVFSLSESSRIKIEIYDLTFHKIRTLTDQDYGASSKHIVTWDGKDDTGNEVSNGTYYYQIIPQNNQNTKKIINKITVLN